MAACLLLAAHLPAACPLRCSFNMCKAHSSAWSIPLVLFHPTLIQEGGGAGQSAHRANTTPTSFHSMHCYYQTCT